MPLALLALFTGLGIWFIWPPAPPAGRGTETAFSVERAIAHVQQIAAEPHPVGSEAHRHALDYLVGQLRALPLDVEVQGGAPDRPQLTNVLARPRQAGGGDVVLLVAHYDSVPTGPGAADDAAGVATLLETARLIASEPHTVNEVAFLFTDGEELGMTGAGAFVKANAPLLGHVRIVLNSGSPWRSSPPCV